jgi:hypothetical protein
MRGQAWNRGLSGFSASNKIPLKEILVRDSTYTNSNRLKKRLIDSGLKKASCEECHLEAWNGEPSSLELDHINGDRFDHRLKNLQLLFLDCHVPTPYYRGKNTGNKG